MMVRFRCLRGRRGGFLRTTYAVAAGIDRIPAPWTLTFPRLPPPRPEASARRVDAAAVQIGHQVHRRSARPLPRHRAPRCVQPGPTHSLQVATLLVRSGRRRPRSPPGARARTHLTGWTPPDVPASTANEKVPRRWAQTFFPPAFEPCLRSPRVGPPLLAGRPTSPHRARSAVVRRSLNPILGG